MKRLIIAVVAAIMMIGMISVPAMAQDQDQDGVTYTQGGDRYIADEVVQSMRAVMTGEKFNADKPVYVLWHKNDWGKHGPNGPNMVELQKAENGDWRAAGMANYVFNVGQFADNQAEGMDWPDNIKWPALEAFGGEKVEGIIRMDGNLTFGPE